MGKLNDHDRLLPGDKIKLTDELTVTAVAAYGDIETEEDITFPDWYNYEVTEQKRPKNWPPEDHDVWKLDSLFGADYYHVLSSGFVDSSGSEVELEEILESHEVSDLELVFRVKEAGK